ncbi:MAG: T9SS type A sorting domain-containing protein, partial [Bacteroidales bacterium]|nr:T9SS type A sorting domain-containing protein [Bacteroidales bacterium]
ARAQPVVENTMDGELVKLQALHELKMPEGYRLKSLPYTKDNTTLAYFPEVFGQTGWSCNQANSIGYVFTYEINAVRNSAANQNNNLYPPLAIWNLLNDGNSGNGVSYFDTWDAILMNGIPSFEDFGYDFYNAQKWMTGYDKYYRGMQNRPLEVYYINTRTADGINTLKHWLDDHLDGSPYGGLANFQIGSTGMKMAVIPEGEEGAGLHLMTSYNERVGHVMTVAGWNDNIRWDFNHDGQYTNDIDINNDGKVDARDWENGAFIVVNSWGQGWGDKGRVFVPYRLLAEDSWHDGVWQSSVTVMRARAEYKPQLTYKVGINYTKRNQLKIVVGVTQDSENSRPDFVIEYPFFNYLGDNIPMQGIEVVGTEEIEIGLDVSPLLAYIDPAKSAKFFLEVYERQGDDVAGHGKIMYFSLMDYGGEEVVETQAAMTDENIKIDAVTRVWVNYNPVASCPTITTDALPQAEVGVGYINSLAAEGGSPPYTWSTNDNQYIAYRTDENWAWPSSAEKILGINDTSRLMVDIGFPFTFYGTTYNQFIVLKDGGLVMGTGTRDYPYVVNKSLYVYQNAGVYPLYTDLEYRFMTDGVYRLDQSDGVIIAWDATLMKYAGVYDPKFGVKLYKDGRIEFGYQAIALNTEWDWISAVSKGDMINSTLPDINIEGLLRGNLRYDFKLFEWPDWLFATETGSLLGTPGADASSMWLPISVEDKYGLKSTKTLFLDVNGGTGVETNPASSKFQVYPNPVSDRFYISLGESVTGEIRVELYQLDGKMILSRIMRADGSDNLKVDLSQLKETGVFIYKIQVGSEVRTGKITR